MSEDTRFVSMWLDYIDYSEFFYERYKEANNEFDSFFPDGTKVYQSSIHTPEENKRFEESLSTRQMYAVSAIMYEALAIESVINFLGADKFGADFFNKNLDMLSFSKKLNVVTKFRTGKEFPKGDAINRRLGQLKDIRDSLAHNKSMEYKGAEEHTKYFRTQLGNEKQDMFELIDSLMGLCKDLIEMLYHMEYGESKVKED